MQSFLHLGYKMSSSDVLKDSWPCYLHRVTGINSNGKHVDTAFINGGHAPSSVGLQDEEWTILEITEGESFEEAFNMMLEFVGYKRKNRWNDDGLDEHIQRWYDNVYNVNVFSLLFGNLNE